jgi:hypothetical protein
MRSPSSARLFPAVLAGAALWCGSGCASTATYKVKVDAIGKSQAGETAVSYRLKNLNPSLTQDDLRYKEAANYVRAALAGRGMYEAAPDAMPDVIVELDYGIAAPSVKMETKSVPVYGQTGGGVNYETIPVTDAQGNVTMRTVPVYQPPQTEVVRYREALTPVPVYEKYLHISARDNKAVAEGQKPAEIWSVNTSLEDESKDLRKYLPLLASASMESIGTDTGRQQTIKLKANDQTVDFVKKGM